MKSITARLVVGSSVVLSVFFILVALSVSWSVHQRAQTARFDRLQGLIYGILGATDIQDDNHLVVNQQALPDSRLNQATSGLYAELVDASGVRIWQSASTASWLPEHVQRPIGDWLFETLQQSQRAPVHRLQLSTAWAFDDGRELPFTVQVVDDADSLDRQLRQFDVTLWATLLGSAIGLLILQYLVLRRSLKPLHDIGEEVTAIEQGRQQSLSLQVPKELQGLTNGLNALLNSERQRHEQYRHLLADLAHSLKTPLSVLHNLARPEQPDGDTIREQTQMMRRSIERHVERARLKGPRYLAPALSVRPRVERVSNTLSKLHRDSGVAFEIALDPGLSVRMDEADLIEILGNLLENACKYGARRIRISNLSDARVLYIDDDGPGFPDVDLDKLLQRGVRADSHTDGTGLGLAAASQLMEAYGGRLEPGRAPAGTFPGAESSGARVSLHLP